MERNSRDVVERIHKINFSAEIICDSLVGHPKIEKIYYPKYESTNYDKISHGKGYGCLFSILFKTEDDAIQFYDKLPLCKGPSLGANFTLVCPYVLLAHYNELDWASSFGISKHLIRVSVGLEDSNFLTTLFSNILDSL